jgi:hypothetical protein
MKLTTASSVACARGPLRYERRLQWAIPGLERAEQVAKRAFIEVASWVRRGHLWQAMCRSNHEPPHVRHRPLLSVLDNETPTIANSNNSVNQW